MMKFGDIILSKKYSLIFTINTSFKFTIAKFIFQRPDNHICIIELNGKLEQVSENDIMEYNSENIKYFINIVENSTNNTINKKTNDVKYKTDLVKIINNKLDIVKNEILNLENKIKLESTDNRIKTLKQLNKRIKRLNYKLDNAKFDLGIELNELEKYIIQKNNIINRILNREDLIKNLIK